ncbi:MAG TPA: hypothetical protein VGC32_00455 [Solirubrobacterales bacterium]
MIFGVDHLVFASTAAERGEIGGRLEAAGARAEAFTLDFPEDGVSSDSWSLASGAYLEFVVEAPGRSGPPLWFDAPTRVIGIGFSSDDFAADVAWHGEEERWQMDEEIVLPDGTGHRIVAAGPHLHASPFYVFVMDRPGRGLDFPPNEAAPALVGIDLHGTEAVEFGTRVAGWLGLPLVDGSFHAGDCEVRLLDGPNEGVRATLRLAADMPAEIPLAVGKIEIEERA